MTRVPLPSAPSGVWREVTWQNDAVPRELERARLEVEPPTAYRQMRIYRASGQLLANEAWTPSRTRELGVRPANRVVKPDEQLQIRAMVWWATPVRLTARLEWKAVG